MAGKTKEMSKIKQVLMLRHHGYSIRKIAAELGGISKNTINEYLQVVERNGYEIDKLLKIDDVELASLFHAGNPAYTDKRMEVFLSELSLYIEELTNRHVTKFLVWEEYHQRHPDGYGKSQFFYHLKQNLIAENKTQTAALSMTYRPGEKIFIDFAGDKLSYIDEDTGEIHKVEMFVASMPYSDYGFALCVESQGSEHFLYALKRCFEFLGGVPKIVVPDNLKSAVIKADKFEPDINKVMEDMGNHYHFVTIPCQPHKPTQKALVEDHVKIVYRRVYAKLRHRTFFSLQELNSAVLGLIADHNQTRMQKRPYSREENFHTNEKPLLQPLPINEFDILYYANLLVQPNGYVELRRNKVTHYYSVPYQYIGKKALIVYTHSIVKIHVDNKCVATHARAYIYGYTTKDEHLASYNLIQTQKSPSYYIERAERISVDFKIYMTRMFDKDTLSYNPPEIKYRTCDMILGLSKRHPLDDFNETCRICCERGVFTGKRFESILKNIPIVNRENKNDYLFSFEFTSEDDKRGSKYYK